MSPLGLTAILEALGDVRVQGPSNTEIVALTLDSRAVVPGSLFAAIPGMIADGHRFVPDALAAGATVLLVEQPPDDLPAGITCLVVPDSRRGLARVASAFHGHPSAALRLVGITGTNGKTTVTYLVESILRRAGAVVGAIGTTGVRLSGHVRPSSHTTPEGPRLHQTLAEMRDSGIDSVVMEVSSHALHQGRATGCQLDTAAFVNLTRDHLDFHGDMERYLAAKQRIVSELLQESTKPERRLVVNVDDPHAEAFSALWPDRIEVSARPGSDAAVHLTDVTFDLKGTRATFATPEGPLAVESSLVGAFNLTNTAVSIGIALALDLPREAIEAGIRALRRVPGRLEPVAVPVDQGGSPDAPRVIVDYAHTPDALGRVLDALRPLVRGEIVTVFGCGGERDRGKRPLMGEAAARGSDRVVVTSDNPRGEPPMAIIDEILPGVIPVGRPHVVEPDRRAAIHQAIDGARPLDLVLIAGKGHERVQVVGDRDIAFEDQAVAREALGVSR